MSRILLCGTAPEVETALLQDGHSVLALALSTGKLAALTGWQARRAVVAFHPDRILAPAEDRQAAALAGQLGITPAAPPESSAYLLAQHLPAPFFDGRTLIVGPPGAMLIPPDIAVITDEPPDVLVDCLAAGCAVVAPDTVAIRALLGDTAALLHVPGDIVARDRLVAVLSGDPALCRSLRLRARATYEARHLAARAALRMVAG